MKKFAVFDIDGTLFRWQLFHAIAFEVMESGHIPAEARKQVEEKLKKWRNREHRHTFKEYEQELFKAFLPYLPKVTVREVEKAADKLLKKSGAQVYVYTRTLIETLRAKGYVLIAISGSQDEVVTRFAKLWKFDLAFGQVYVIKDGRYTGAFKDDALLVDDKGALLKQIVEEHGLSWKHSYAVGDSLSDAKLLELVEHPIAFNPDEPLFKVAQSKGWRIVLERKQMIYELEQRDGVYILAATNAE